MSAVYSFSSCADVFFFQAEDGIRDRDVTGVQTCALPIYEAFSAQLLACLKAMDSSRFAAEKLGLAKAMGSPDRKSVV